MYILSLLSLSVLFYKYNSNQNQIFFIWQEFDMMTIIKQNQSGFFFRTSSLIKVGKSNSESAGVFLVFYTIKQDLFLMYHVIYLWILNFLIGRILFEVFHYVKYFPILRFVPWFWIKAIVLECSTRCRRPSKSTTKSLLMS